MLVRHEVDEHLASPDCTRNGDEVLMPHSAPGISPKTQEAECGRLMGSPGDPRSASGAEIGRCTDAERMGRADNVPSFGSVSIRRQSMTLRERPCAQ